MSFKVMRSDTVDSYRFKGALDFDVELPKGFMPVCYRIPKKGEHYLFGTIVVRNAGKMKRPYLIVREDASLGV